MDGKYMIYFITSRNNGKNDIEKVMKQVNSYVNSNNKVGFAEANQYKSLEYELEQLLILADKVSTDCKKMLEGTITSGGHFSQIKNLIKKLLRKCIRWYMKDFMVNQIEFNSQITYYLKQQIIIDKNRLCKINEGKYEE